MKRSVSDDDVRDDDDRGKRHRGGSGFRTEIRMLVLSRVCLCTFAFIRSTPKSRPNNIYMGLKCPSVRTSVCPSAKVFPIPMKFGM